MACEVALESDDVPPLQNYADSIYAFRERISTGEITRRIHLEDWHRYMRTKDNSEAADTASEMDGMFARIRQEIAGMERRSAEFKRMVDELVRMVEEMPNYTRIHAYPVNGFSTHAPTSRSSVRSRLVRSPSDLTSPPLLANSRARLPPPPLRALAPPIPPRLPTPSSPSAVAAAGAPGAAASVSATSILASASLHRLRQTNTPLRTAPPPPPQAAQRYTHIHRRFFPRAFWRTLNPPAPAPRTPSPRGTPAQPAGSDFPENRQASTIAETRTRLPPPPDTPPIPYRAPVPGQTFLSFMQRN